METSYKQNTLKGECGMGLWRKTFVKIECFKDPDKAVDYKLLKKITFHFFKMIYV